MSMTGGGSEDQASGLILFGCLLRAITHGSGRNAPALRTHYLVLSVTEPQHVRTSLYMGAFSTHSRWLRHHNRRGPGEATSVSIQSIFKFRLTVSPKEAKDR